MKRAIVIGLVLSLIAIVAACKQGGPHSCASDATTGCVCKNETFPLAAWQKPTNDCAAPKAELSQCCHDLDSKGESSFCTCSRAVCLRYESGICSCAMSSDSGGAKVAPFCDAAREDHRCCQAEDGTCRCNAFARCLSGEKQVTRCDASTISPACKNAAHDAKSCDGIKWKSKT